MKTWILRNEAQDVATLDNKVVQKEHIAAFSALKSMTSHEVGKAHVLGISPLLLHILQHRGFIEEKDIQNFLTPNLRLLEHPDTYFGVSKASETIVKLLLEGKKFAIWGDYDVDGITSTALVMDVLQAHGYTAMAHIPERYEEGYGLNIPNIQLLADQGVEVIVTVDCGVSDFEAISYAKDIGLFVIVSDHHLPPEVLPPADAMCNPRMGECPCPDLAGVGMAFMLMCAVNKALEKVSGKTFDMRKVLDLVALGTLADMVSLRGQIRLLVKNGLLTIA